MRFYTSTHLLHHSTVSGGCPSGRFGVAKSVASGLSESTLKLRGGNSNESKKSINDGDNFSHVSSYGSFAKGINFLESQNGKEFLVLENYQGTAPGIAGETYTLIDWQYWNSLGDETGDQHWIQVWKQYDEITNQDGEYDDSSFDDNFAAYKSKHGQLMQVKFNEADTAVTTGTPTLTIEEDQNKEDLGIQVTIRQIMRGAKNNIWFLGDPESYFTALGEDSLVVEAGEYYVEFYTAYGDSSGYIKVEDGKITPPSKPSTDPKPATDVKMASATSAKVLVDNKSVDFEAYIIDNSNYIKLRDFAYAISGTNKQFEVSWDPQKGAINLISNKSYSPNGSELGKGYGKATSAALNKSKIYKDEAEVNLTAYTINGNNYFKLRDLADAFHIEVTWDGATSTIGIDTSGN